MLIPRNALYSKIPQVEFKQVVLRECLLVSIGIIPNDSTPAPQLVSLTSQSILRHLNFIKKQRTRFSIIWMSSLLKAGIGKFQNKTSSVENFQIFEHTTKNSKCSSRRKRRGRITELAPQRMWCI